MAKSIRSKWKRKCRAIKRIRYGEKELERLKKTLANDHLKTGAEVKEVLKDIAEIANVKTAEEIAAPELSDVMEVEEIKRKFNAKTLRDKNGAFPVWVHPRKTKSRKRKNKKKSKKNVKRNN